MIQSGTPASPLACAGRKLGRRLSHIAEGRYEAKFADTAPCRSTWPPSSHRGGPESSFRGRQEAAILSQLARCCSPDGGHCHPGQLTMSCAAPEASPREQVGTKHVVGGTSYGDDPTSLRDSAIRLAEAGQVRAAIPLFQAVVALDPSKPLGHSDEGVSWMRLKEYDQARPCDPRLSDARVNALPPQPCHRLPPCPAVQSWGAFKRALDLDPAHGLSLQNRRDLTGFLSHTSEGQRIMQAALWRARWLSLWPTGAPEASLSASSCSGLPRTSQPGPVSLVGRAGRPHRACFPHRRADDPNPPPRPPRPREHMVSPLPRLG